MASNNVQQQQQIPSHYQAANSQQQQENTSAYHCKECGVYLNSAQSLDVHVRYHKDNLLNKWASQAATSQPQQQHSDQETNNNTKGVNKREFLSSNTIAAAADSSEPPSNMKKSPEYANRSTPETNQGSNNSTNNNGGTAFGHPPTPQSYHSASSPYQNPENSSFSPGFQNYQIKQERASPTQHFQQNFYSENFYNMDNSQNSTMGYNHQEYVMNKIGAQNSVFRYHPYQQHYERTNQANQPQVTSSSPAYPPQPTPSPSPKQCDKCGYVCESAAQLIDHLNVAHPPTPAPHMGSYQNFMFASADIKVEEDNQSEILDLDSHKVHQVYSEEEKRQNGEMSHNPHSVSAMLNQWPPQTNPQNVSQQQKIYVQDQRMYAAMEQKIFPNGMIQEKLFLPQHPGANDFLPNGTNTTAQDPLAQPQQGYRPFEMAPQAAPSVISSTQVPVTGPPQNGPPPSTKSANWKSNEARRPKTYNCTACNKWFTSSGHLKRHYNTTLHKNAVKSSGQPDPATMPISVHHHPARDQNNRDDQSSSSPHEDSRDDSLSQSFERPPSIPGLLQQPPNGPYDRQPAPNIHHSMGHISNLPGSPPNGEAGPSATANMDSRGLLSLNTTPNTTTNNSSPHGFIPPPMMAPMENSQFQMYPNGVAPHVTQVITSNRSTTGEMIHHHQQYGTSTSMVNETQQALPSFAQFQAHRYGLILGYNGATVNVGGPGPVTAPYSYYSDSYDTPESRALLFRQEEDYKITVLTPPDPSMEGDMYSPHNNNNNNNNHLDLVPTDGDLKMELKYETPASPEKAHIKRDYEENSNPQITSTVNTAKQQGLHKCFDCDKVFNKSCYLTQHNKTFHSGDKPFKCSRCGKRFSCENQYVEHQGKHAGEKPHKCDLCPKQFNHKTDLRRHMCLHTGQKPYACDTCGKGFIRKDHMLKHCDTHIRRPHSKLSAVR